MSFDLALDKNNDLLLGPNSDLLGVSGLDLIEQRIRIRLKIERGSWIYDEAGTLGSKISSVLGRSSDQAMSELNAYVHQALEAMDDISVSSVDLVPSDNDRSIILTVKYLSTIATGEIPHEFESAQLSEAVIQFEF